MAVRIGSLLIRLAVEHGLLQEGLAVAEKDVAKTTKAIERRGREIADFGKSLSLAVTLPIAGLAASSIKAAKESADALGQVNAALASMGDASGRTSEQLQALAGAQMRQSLFDDDQILREVTANLLTFGRVAGQEFDRAQQAALDLSTRLGTDLTSATVQIGKALNDPIKGMAALSKAGIQFTADQKAMIASMVEAGDVAGAQRIILSELESQFGGAAQAAREADPGAAATQAFAQFQEEVGGKLLPLLPAITDAITGILDAFSSLPDGVQTSIIVIGGLAAALGPVLIGLGAIVSAGAGTIATLTSLKLAFDFAGIIRNLLPMISALRVAMLGLLANPILLAAAVVIGGIFLAWQNWDKIKPIIDRVVAAVTGFWNDNLQPVLTALGGLLVKAVSWWINLQVGALKSIAALVTGVKDWLIGRLGAVFDYVGDKIRAVTGFFFDMYDAVVGNSYVPDMVDGIKAEFDRLDAVMVAPASKATAAVTEAARTMARDVSALLDRLFPEIAAARRQAEELSLLDRGGLSDDARAAARLRLLQEGQGDAPVSPGLLDTGPLEEVDKVREAVDGILRETERLGERTEVQTVRIAETFKQMTDQVLGSLRGLVDGIRSGDFLSILEGALGIFSQLGGAGLFGGGVQSFLQGTPGFANGTAFAPGGLALVGERGPEVINLPRGGRVIPNHELRAANDEARVRVMVGIDRRNGNVTGFVDDRIGRAAPVVADLGAQQAQQRAAQSARRRVR